MELDPRIGGLFSKLVEIDNSGTFVAILLEELNQLSDLAYETGEQIDRTEEVLSFMEYLLEEARRGIGEEIRLGYSSTLFKVGIILLAKSHRALTEGPRPYMNRMDYYIKMGSDSIYLIAYSQAFEFYDRLISVFQGDERISLQKSTTVSSKENGGGVRRIALYKRVPMFVDQSFAEKVVSLGLTRGTVIAGKILQAAKNYVLVDVLGLNGIVNRGDCSWRTIPDCTAAFTEGTDVQFIVTEIDSSKCQLILSGRTPESDPWRMVQVPQLGDRVEVKFFELTPSGMLALSQGGVEVLIPRNELTWSDMSEEETLTRVGSTSIVEIIELDPEARKIRASVKKTLDDPWPGIAAKYPNGKTFRGEVVAVDYTAVRVRAPGGEIGIIPRAAMIQAGFEYKDFEKTVVPGQGLDVVVRGVSLVS